jgi:hypothetical protein
MTESLHPQVAALLARYRAELERIEPSDALDARMDRLVAGDSKPAWRPVRRLPAWAAAAGLAVLAIATGIFIGMRLERAAPAGPSSPRTAQLATPLSADFSLWPSDSVALQIPAEYSAQGTLVAVDPGAHSTGKRYWIDVVVSNDGTIRIDGIVPADPTPNLGNKGAPDGITLQTP